MQADLDALTALLSRRYLDSRLPFDYESTGEQGKSLVVALLDDYSGQVNENYGWPSEHRDSSSGKGI